MAYSVIKNLALSLASACVFIGSLVPLNVQDRISLQRGLSYSLLGLTHFVLLNDFLNEVLIRRYRLKSDALEIANKLVSALQSTYSCVAGFIVCRSSCARGLNASHYMSESYAWFGAAYFFYDLWSMYKVHLAKVADKLFLNKLKASSHAARFEDRNSYDASNGNGHLLDASEEESLRYREICDGYENEIQILECGQPNFFRYLLGEPLMLIHHLFIGSFGLAVISVLRGGFGDCIFSHIYIMEVSTPFVSFRSILSTMGMKEHRLYLINGLAMLFTFFIFRICLLPYLFIWYSSIINVPVLTAIMSLPRGCKISIAILFLPQYYWFYLICKGAMKVFFPKKKSKAALSGEGESQTLSNGGDIVGQKSKPSKKVD